MRGTGILHSGGYSMPGRRRKTKRRKRCSQRGGNVWGPLPKEIAWARQAARKYGRRLQQRGGGFMEPPMLPSETLSPPASCLHA